MRCAFVDGDGVVRGVCVAASVEDAKLMAGAWTVLELAEGQAPPIADRAQWNGETFVDRRPDPPAPDEFRDHVWDDVLRQWVPVETVAGHRRRLSSRVNSLRDAALRARSVGASGIPFSVMKDRQNLAERIQSREVLGIAPEVQTDWKDEDNTIHAANLDFHVALTADLVARTESVMQHSWALKAAIDEASTHEALDMIDMTGGWP